MRECLENISLTTVGYFLDSTSVKRHYPHDCQHCKHLGTLTKLSRDPHVYRDIEPEEIERLLIEMYKRKDKL